MFLLTALINISLSDYSYKKDKSTKLIYEKIYRFPAFLYKINLYYISDWSDDIS